MRKVERERETEGKFGVVNALLYTVVIGMTMLGMVSSFFAYDS